MEINIYIGSRLKEQREALGKSQTEFAEIAAAAGAPGSTRQSQAKYEKGLAAPSAAYLAAIATAGVDVLYILTGQPSGYAVAPPAVRSPAEPSPAYAKNKEEEALLDNYRNSPPEGQSAIRTTSAALAKQKSTKDKRDKAA